MYVLHWSQSHLPLCWVVYSGEIRAGAARAICKVSAGQLEGRQLCGCKAQGLCSERVMMLEQVPEGTAWLHGGSLMPSPKA